MIKFYHYNPWYVCMVINDGEHVLLLIRKGREYDKTLYEGERTKFTIRWKLQQEISNSELSEYISPVRRIKVFES